MDRWRGTPAPRWSRQSPGESADVTFRAGMSSAYTTVSHDAGEDEVAVEEPLEIRVDGEPPARLEQPGFERTGGLHATGLFDSGGELMWTREDVGRHNAMDKVVGRALLDGVVPLGERILCVSGRLSFELVQKAAVAGAPILVGVGAPTSLAVSLAADRGLTLGGFARGGRLNVYTGAERVT